MTDNKNASTTKTTMEVDDMDEILGTKASTVIIPTEDSKKSVLASTKVDTSFLDNDPDDSDKDDEDKDKTKPDSLKDTAKADDVANILDGNLTKTDTDLEDSDDDTPGAQTGNKGGRKPALIEAMTKLVEKGILELFTDQPDVSTYTIEDFEELIESNINQKVNETATKVPMEIFGKLDPKLQDVIAYSLKGGKDIELVLKNVMRSQEVTNLSVDNPEHHERIVREWLRETDFGTDEEIEDEIAAYTDRGDLPKKAEQFKPKLDKKSAEIMQNKLLEADEKQKSAEEAQKVYAETIYKALDQKDLNGIPLNNRIQTSLYYGIVDSTQYQDRNGNPTNKLGHLIEKFQFGKDADPARVLEALWVLDDPQGYREAFGVVAEQKSAGRTARELRTAEGSRTTSSSKQGDGEAAPTNRQPLERRGGRRSIFARD